MTQQFKRDEIASMNNMFQHEMILKAYDKLIEIFGDAVVFNSNGMAYKHFSIGKDAIRVRCEDGIILKESGFGWDYKWEQVGKINL